MQIKNLSAAQVQPFGEILSAESELLPPCAERWQIRPGADVRELRADGPVVLDYVSGMPLLVIYEKDARSVYYLDRVLALRPGRSEEHTSELSHPPESRMPSSA